MRVVNRIFDKFNFYSILYANTCYERHKRKAKTEINLATCRAVVADFNKILLMK